MAQQNQKTINELKLEIQELRQALLAVFNKFNGAQGIPDNIRDHFWEKLGNHPKVEVDEDLMDCCEGGPQWGHAWSCPNQI